MAVVGEVSAEEPREFFVLFAHHNCYFNMRFHELEAIASCVGAVPRGGLYVGGRPTSLDESPLAHVRLKGGEASARAICQRSVLVQVVLDVWTLGASFPEAVLAGNADRTLAARRRAATAPPRTFEIKVKAFGHTPTMEEKREVLEQLRPLFEGDEVADLRSPDTVIWALAEHRFVTEEKTHLGPRSGAPIRVVIGRQVAGGRSTEKKHANAEKPYWHHYELSQRAVLGPTTLENELAFVMANHAQVRQNSVVLDPFCGTAGLLVAASHFGARAVGGEIDIRVAKGWRVAYIKNRKAALEVERTRSQEASAAAAPVCASSASAGAPPAPTPAAGAPPAPAEAEGPTASKGRRDDELEKDVFVNFIQYQMQLPEIVICDTARCPWRATGCGWVDSIVTDPPYGIRAAMKQQGRDAEKGPAFILDKANFIPSKVNYGEEDLSNDLLGLAAEALVDDGRLCFLFPVDLADFLGIDRGEGAGGKPSSKREVVMGKRDGPKDPRLCISETTRDPLLIDEARYPAYLPTHADMELVSASLQVLSGGLGRLLVTMRRLPRSRSGGP